MTDYDAIEAGMLEQARALAPRIDWRLSPVPKPYRSYANITGEGRCLLITVGYSPSEPARKRYWGNLWTHPDIGFEGLPGAIGKPSVRAVLDGMKFPEENHGFYSKANAELGFTRTVYLRKKGKVLVLQKRPSERQD